MLRRTFVTVGTAAFALSSIGIRRIAWASGSELPALGPDGKQISLGGADVDDFRAGLRGELLTRGQDGYDAARRVWNGAFDRKPALIARCAGTADVMRSLAFGRAHGLIVAVRGGGHSMSGQSVCEGGLMIDLSPMKSVHIDPVAKRGRIEAGVLLGQFDAEAQAFGLATTAGTVSHTGAAGLTLGGGFGRIGRRFGLACDNMCAAEIVTANGKLLRVSEQENADLLWGLRGGGGNFGVVTSFEYRMHKVDSIMLGGPLIYPLAQARAAFSHFADFVQTAPDVLYADAILTTGPGGQRIFALDLCYSGPLAQGERVLAPLRSFGKPIMDGVRPTPYVKLQQSADEVNRHGRFSYSKSGFLRRIEPNMVSTCIEHVSESTVPAGATVIFAHHGGAISRVKPAASAFFHREAQHSVLVLGIADKAEDAPAATQWARNLWKAAEPMTNGFYVNEVNGDDPEKRIRGSYGANYPRLVALKTKYDPTNLLRMNANIKPAA